MTPDALAVAGVVAVLLPTLYFLIASPTFLLVKFDDPVVTWLFRTVLGFHFKLTAIATAIAVAAYGFAGHPVLAILFALIGFLAVAMRRWFLRNLDAEISARDGGDVQAVRRLRGLHWRGMAYNAAQLATLAAIVPIAFPAAA